MHTEFQLEKLIEIAHLGDVGENWKVQPLLGCLEGMCLQSMS